MDFPLRIGYNIVMTTYVRKSGIRREKAEDAFRKALQGEAHKLVRLLADHGFQCKRVYLWGSAIKNKPLSPWSDIDLVIEGLPQAIFYNAHAFLLKHSDFPVDLKPFEELNDSAKNNVREEGKVIYEEN